MYPDGQYCMWRIVVKASFQVALMFTRFSLQSENNTDAVYVYDVNNQTREVLGVFYGGQPPPRNGIYSSSNSLLVIFRSDKDGSFSGFQASYSAVKCSGKRLLIDSITNKYGQFQSLRYIFAKTWKIICFNALGNFTKIRTSHNNWYY